LIDRQWFDLMAVGHARRGDRYQHRTEESTHAMTPHQRAALRTDLETNLRRC
jgi:hypothetical protein